jgi:hypothetical protein
MRHKRRRNSSYAINTGGNAGIYSVSMDTQTHSTGTDNTQVEQLTQPSSTQTYTTPVDTHTISTDRDNIQAVQLPTQQAKKPTMSTDTQIEGTNTDHTQRASVSREANSQEQTQSTGSQRDDDTDEICAQQVRLGKSHSTKLTQRRNTQNTEKIMELPIHRTLNRHK